MTRPANIGYSVRETLENGRVYDCGLCPHSSPTVDAARAHYAVHVAGPELLAAIKPLRESVTFYQDDGPNSEGWKSDELLAEMKAADDAIVKAEPKGA